MIRGILVIAVALAVPGFLFLQIEGPTSALISQYIGVSALIAMSLSQLMATRAWFVEYTFGPLDRTYVLHKWLGIGALVAILLHDSIGAEIKTLQQATNLADLGESLGELSLNGLLVLGGITLITFIPYRFWYWTHRAIGACFVLGAAHYLLIPKPFSIWDPLGLYVLGFCLIGVLAYIYCLLPGSWRKGQPYKVSQVSTTGNATVVTLIPEGRPIRHRAGQFAFFTVEETGLGETHPFTISSGPREDGTLQISVAPLGGYTMRLCRHIKPGMKVKVQGPYGRFSHRRNGLRQVWVAGGIGITPFLAWLDDLQPKGPAIDLFYSFRGTKNAPHLAELAEKAAAFERLTIHHYDTTSGRRLTSDDVSSLLQNEKAIVAFCGPKALRQEIGREISKRRFHYEEFEIRTGLPYMRPLFREAERWLRKLGDIGFKGILKSRGL